MSGFDNEVLFAENWDFRGTIPVEAQATSGGDLPIGTGGSPSIKVGNITSSTLTVGYSDPNITIEAGETIATTYVSNSGSAVSTNNILNVLGTGDITTSASGNTLSIFYSSPFFAANEFFSYLSADATNVTGAGTVYTVIFDMERYDVGSAYNTSTGVFTAPVTGKYQFNGFLEVSSITISVTSHIWNLVTSNASYVLFANIGSNLILGELGFNWSVLADMEAGDTAYVTVTADGLALDTVDVEGSSSPYSGYFSGYRVI